jgi:hypothetical protein
MNKKNQPLMRIEAAWTAYLADVENKKQEAAIRKQQPKPNLQHLA